MTDGRDFPILFLSGEEILKYSYTIPFLPKVCYTLFMTPGSRTYALIDLLQRFYETGLPADVVAVNFYRDNKYIGSTDRRFLTHHFFDFFRHKGAVNGALRLYGMKSNPVAEILGYWVCVEKVPLEELYSWGHDSAYAFGKVDLELEGFLQWAAPQKKFDLSPTEQLNIPYFLLPLLEKRFSETLTEELKGLNQEAPVDVRVNTLKITRDEALSILEKTFNVEPTPYSPVGIRCLGRPPITSHILFEEGKIEIQDEGSQLASLLCQVKPGMSVLDLCAGAGGKTLSLAAQMKNKGRLFACDIYDKRLAKAKIRFRRAGVHNVTTHVLTEGDKWVKRHANAFDCVLVDAPCSGTGTWRRNPDARWRISQQCIETLKEQQQNILQTSQSFVKKGGRLVYVTCSVLAEENEEQIEKFLHHNPTYSLLPMGEIWQSMGAGQPYRGHPLYAIFTPHTYQTDGFFVAVLEKAQD